MSINGALQLGRTALASSQAALQVAGNNMANAATPGFHRRSIRMAPLTGESVGRNMKIGRGVQIVSIRRELDLGLQARFRDAMSSQSRSMMDQRFLTAVETLQNELTDNDLSSVVSNFFNSFSELANNPEDNAVRSLVIQQGVSVAERIASMRTDYNSVIGEIDREIGNAVRATNDLLDQIAQVNGKIVSSEGATGEASSLRDQRDMLIDELAQFVEVDVINHDNGNVDILVNSLPILLAGENRGLEVRTESKADGLNVSVRIAADGSTLQLNSGRIGGLMRQREDTVNPVLDQLDSFAGQLIYQVNRLHSQGQGQTGLTSLTGTYLVDDTTANLNASATNLPFKIENGSFFVHMTHQQTGIRSTVQIDVDGNADSLDDLIASINSQVANLSAGTGLGNVLTLDTDPGYEVSFSDDTSGALAALGINTFFNGRNASDIEVHQDLIGNPGLLAAGTDHVAGSAGTAIAIADLQNKGLDDLGGASLRQFWQNSINDLAVRTNAANNSVDATTLVMDSLDAQIQSVSGVSLDEEALDLITYQRQFQASARFIATIDEILQTLISLG